MVKKVYAVRMDPDAWKKLVKIQRTTGATPGEQIRRGIELWLQKQSK